MIGVNEIILKISLPLNAYIKLLTSINKNFNQFNRDLSREFGIPISSFSPSVREIHFQKKFSEANLPFIPPNIIIS